MSIAAIGGGTIAQAGSGTSSGAVTYNLGVGGGTNCFICFVNTVGAVTGLTVQDNLGNTLSAGPSNGNLASFYQFPIPSGVTSYTASWTTSREFGFLLQGYSGVNAVNASATGNSNSGTSAAPTITIITQDNNDWSVSCLADQGLAIITATTGTGRQHTSFGPATIVDNTAASAGNVTCAGSMPASHPWNAVAIELRTLPPTATSCSPNNGSAAGGTAVTITGTNFVSGASVTFGGNSATSVVVVNSTTITCNTPAHAAGLVNVAVTTSAGTGTATNAFTYNPAPTVTLCSPNNGDQVGGNSVTITGTNFVATPTVTFGGVAATSVAWISSTSLTCVTPAHSGGTVNVVVTNPDAQSGTESNGYTYNLLPTVTLCSPNNGIFIGGTAVTITGSNFVPTPTVTFGGNAATGVVWVNSTSLTCVTPAYLPPGAVDIVVVNPDSGSGTEMGGYTYFTPAVLGFSKITFRREAGSASPTAVEIDPGDFVVVQTDSAGGTVSDVGGNVYSSLGNNLWVSKATAFAYAVTSSGALACAVATYGGVVDFWTNVSEKSGSDLTLTAGGTVAPSTVSFPLTEISVPGGGSAEYYGSPFPTIPEGAITQFYWLISGFLNLVNNGIFGCLTGDPFTSGFLDTDLSYQTDESHAGLATLLSLFPGTTRSFGSSPALVSVDAASAGSTTYRGSVSNFADGSQGAGLFLGENYVISNGPYGYQPAQNLGIFKCTGGGLGTLVLNNPNGIASSSPGQATLISSGAVTTNTDNSWTVMGWKHGGTSHYALNADFSEQSTKGVGTIRAHFENTTGTTSVAVGIADNLVAEAGAMNIFIYEKHVVPLTAVSSGGLGLGVYQGAMYPSLLGSGGILADFGYFVISGFANAGNNGVFCQSTDAPTSMTLVNSNVVPETHAATLTYFTPVPYDGTSAYMACTAFDMSPVPYPGSTPDQTITTPYSGAAGTVSAG